MTSMTSHPPSDLPHKKLLIHISFIVCIATMKDICRCRKKLSVKLLLSFWYCCFVFRAVRIQGTLKHSANVVWDFHHFQIWPPDTQAGPNRANTQWAFHAFPFHERGRAQTKLSRKSEASACVQSLKVIFKRWKSIHAISAHPLILTLWLL